MRGVGRARHKLHEGPKTPSCWRTQNMKAFNRGFEPGLQNGVTLEATNRLLKLRRKEIVFRNIHSIPSSEKNVVNGAVTSIVEPNLHLSTNQSNRNDRTSQMNGHIPQPIHQPAGTSRTHGAFAQTVLK